MPVSASAARATTTTAVARTWSTTHHVVGSQSLGAAVDGLGCGARRTRYFRLDRPEEIAGHDLAAELPCALVVLTDEPVRVTHTRGSRLLSRIVSRVCGYA